jgi:hypothetical protein
LTSSRRANTAVVGDPFEREAEKVASDVVRSGDAHKAQNAVPRGPSSPLPAGINTSGIPLPPDTRKFFESRFRFDFSNIRIHSDRSAAESAWAIRALAYTAGSHIVFGKDQYDPASLTGRHLIAHELAHTIHQSAEPDRSENPLVHLRTPTPTVQRNVVPPEYFAKLIAEIDDKLADEHLTDEQRIALLLKRQEYYDDLPPDDPNRRIMIPSTGVIPAGMQSAKNSTPDTAPAAGKPQTALKKVPTTGTPGNKASSARAAAKAEQNKSPVSPPSTPYENTNPLATADEQKIGSRLNEMAVSRKLGEVKKVVARAERPGATSDYVFAMKDGSEVTADLYQPRGDRSPEDIGNAAIQSKSGQAEIVVIELAGKNALETAQRIADMMIATPGHSIKRLIAIAENQMVLNRRLFAEGRGLERIRARVLSRLTERTQAEPIRRPAPDPKPASSASETSKRGSRSSPFDLRIEQGFLADRPLEITEAPSGTGISTHGAIEGAWALIAAGLYQHMQQVEVEKIYDAYERLAPQIEQLRSAGLWVQINGLAQVPDSIDVLVPVVGFGAPNQIVKFVSLGIESFGNEKFSKPASMSADHRTGPVPQPDPGYHFASGVLVRFAPYAQIDK